MNAAAIGLSAGSLVVAVATTVNYFSKIAEGKVRPQIASLVVQLFIGLGLATSAIVFAVQKEVLGAAVIVPAAIGGMLSMFLLYLLSLRKTPIGELKIKVGDKLLAFESMTSKGVRFHSEEFADRRILLKFFRGGW